MSICIVVLSDEEKANQLGERLQKAGIALIRCDLIKPRSTDITEPEQETKETAIDPLKNAQLIPIDIDNLELLNPNLSQKSRQKKMSMLLMPFGFIAGFTFTKLTGLTTFSDVGIGYLGESLSGGLIGMASGLMGRVLKAMQL